MELSRSDFQILNVLKEHQCTNYQETPISTTKRNWNTTR